jgi:hypothetical protein
MGGIIGLDWLSIMTAADAVGVDRDAVALMLPSVEAGLRAAVANREEREEIAGPDKP